MQEKTAAIIFDIGNVLIDVDLDICPQMWAAASGVDVDEVRKIFWDDSHYQQLERGEITLRQYHEIFAELLPQELGFEDFHNGWVSILKQPVSGMFELVEQLHGRVRMVCLSNTNAAHVEDFMKKFPQLFSRFECNFFSNEMQLRKPDAEIYKHVLDYLCLDPQQVAFVDDKPENVRAADAVGLRGIHFADAANFRQALGI